MPAAQRSRCSPHPPTASVASSASAGRAGRHGAGHRSSGRRWWSRSWRRRSRRACRCRATCRTCCRRRRRRCATCTRWKRAPRCSGRSSSRSNRTTPSGARPPRAWCAIGWRRFPPARSLGVSADSAAKDRFVWDHRHLLIPTEDLTAIRDELAQRKARLNPLFVAARRRRGRGGRGRAGAGRSPARAEAAARRGEGGRGASDAAGLEGRPAADHRRANAASPRGEVSRNAPALRRGRARGRRGPAGGRAGGAHRDHRRRRHQRDGAAALLGGMVRATVFTVVIVAIGMLLFFRSAAAVGGAAGRAGAGRAGDVRLRAPRRRPPEPGDGVPGADRRRQRHQLRHHPARALLRGAAEDRRSGGGAGRGRPGQPGRDPGRGADGVGVLRLAARDRLPRLPALRPDRRRRDPALLGSPPSWCCRPRSRRSRRAAWRAGARRRGSAGAWRGWRRAVGRRSC